MILKKLSLINFKNIERQVLAPEAGINCFVGDNGTCKTNIIDSIYYLSMCKSSLPVSDAQCVRHGESFFVIDGEYAGDDGRTERINCSFTRQSPKIMKRNGKQYERLADHIGLIPVVIVSPADSSLINDSAEERRRYLNGFISQLDGEYLAATMRYNTTLAERNKFLKISSDEQMLLIYDRQLTATGSRIFEARRRYIEMLQPVAAEFYSILSGDREQVGLAYRSELAERPFDEILLAARERDLVNGFTSSGVHRDDLIFTIGGMPLRKFGSQGQQKSFLIALKLAQYRIIAKQRGQLPILLLDDVFDKLDEGRVAELLHIVGGEGFGQIFITDCNRERMERTLGGCRYEHKIFNTVCGKVAE